MINEKDILTMTTETVYENPQEGSITVNGNNYEIVKVNFDEYESSIDYMIVKKGDEHIMVFQGSQDQVDWLVTNPTLPSDFVTDGISDASQAYQKESSTYNITTVSGNSLGGAHAAYTATQNDNLKCITLNSATLPSTVENKYNNEIKNYYTNADVLSLLQNGTGIDTHIYGERILLDYNNYNSDNLSKNHRGFNSLSYTPIDLFTNEIITNSSLSKTLKINTDGLNNLINNLTHTVSEQFDLLTKNINLSNNMIKSNISTRILREQNLKKQFDIGITSYIKENFTNIYYIDQLISITQNSELQNIIGTYNTYNDISNILLNLKNIIYYIKQSDLYEFLSTLTPLDDILDNPIINLPFTLLNISTTIVSIFKNLALIISNDLPLLFKDLKNIDDGFSKELQLHFESIYNNNIILKNKFETFVSYSNYVVNEFSNTDYNISTNSNINLTSFDSSNFNTNLVQSEIVNNFFNSISNILENNFSKFNKNVCSKLEPIFYSLNYEAKSVRKLLLKIHDIISSLTLLTSKISSITIIDIPFITIDDSLRYVQDLLKNFQSLLPFIENIDVMLSSIINISDSLASDTSTLLNNFKPYIYDALFDKVKLLDLSVYNTNSSNYLSSLKITFNNVFNSIKNDNEFSAKYILDELSLFISKDIDLLNTDIEKCILKN